MLEEKLVTSGERRRWGVVEELITSEDRDSNKPFVYGCSTPLQEVLLSIKTPLYKMNNNEIIRKYSY